MRFLLAASIVTLWASASRAEPCSVEHVMLCGKIFLPDETLVPGFDPCAARQRAPDCDGVLLPAEEAARILALEDERDRVQAELVAEKAGRAADQREADRALGACQEGRRLCEKDRTTCPKCPGPGFNPWAAGAIGAGLTAVVLSAVLLLAR